jgi:hypothetical protein
MNTVSTLTKGTPENSILTSAMKGHTEKMDLWTKELDLGHLSFQNQWEINCCLSHPVYSTFVTSDLID